MSRTRTLLPIAAVVLPLFGSGCAHGPSNATTARPVASAKVPVAASRHYGPRPLEPEQLPKNWLDAGAARARALEWRKAYAQKNALPQMVVPPLPRYRQPVFFDKAISLAPPAGDPPNVWAPIGPAPILVAGGSFTGRVSAIAFGAGATFAAGEYGGVWGTGRFFSGAWVPLTDTQVTPAISSLAVAPSNPKVLYAGTGVTDQLSPCTTGGGYEYQGILKSIDAGQTWNLVANNSFAGVSISKLIVDPRNELIVYAATGNGTYRSVDGAANWTRVSTGPSLGCTSDIAMSPGTAHTLYETGWGTTSKDANGNSIYYAYVQSSTNGLNWTPVVAQPTAPATTLWPSQSNIAVSNGPNGDVVYLSVAAWDSTADATNSNNPCHNWAAFRSTDGGGSWTNLGVPGANGTSTTGFCQIGIVNSLAASPTKPDVAAFGGGWLFVWNNGWLNNGNSLPGNNSAASFAGHSDIRTLAFNGLGNLFIGSDGGLHEILDPTNVNGDNSSYNSNGFTLNQGGLQLTEFYSGIAVAPDGSFYMGGSQDNGTEIYSGSFNWNQIEGGDGGGCAIDTNNGQNVVLQTDFGTTLFSSSNKGANVGTANVWTTDANGNPVAATDLPGFFTYKFATAPTFHGTTKSVMYTGFHQVFQSFDSGANWTQLQKSVLATNGTPQVWSVTTDPSIPDHVFVGWSDGSVTFSPDAGSSWTTVRGAPADGNGVSAIAVSPHDSGTLAIATFTANSDAQRVLQGVSVTSGTPAWTNITGNLPNVYGYNAIIYSGTGLIVATDIGVFGTTDSTLQNWAVVGSGLPNSQVSDIKWTSSGNLVAFTYGRGAWQVSSGGAVTVGSLAVAPNRGPVGGGTNVALAGRLPNNTTFNFGGAPITPTANNVTSSGNTIFNVVSPPSPLPSPGAGTVGIEAYAETVAPNHFLNTTQLNGSFTYYLPEAPVFLPIVTSCDSVNVSAEVFQASGAVDPGAVVKFQADNGLSGNELISYSKTANANSQGVASVFFPMTGPINLSAVNQNDPAATTISESVVATAQPCFHLSPALTGIIIIPPYDIIQIPIPCLADGCGGPADPWTYAWSVPIASEATPLFLSAGRGEPEDMAVLKGGLMLSFTTTKQSLEFFKKSPNVELSGSSKEMPGKAVFLSPVIKLSEKPGLEKLFSEEGTWKIKLRIPHRVQKGESATVAWYDTSQKTPRWTTKGVQLVRRDSDSFTVRLPKPGRFAVVSVRR